MTDFRNTRTILQAIEHQLRSLRHEVRTNRWDEALGDFAMNQNILDKIREATTVSASTNIAVREVIRILKAAQDDPAKVAEAMELLEAMRADDAALLTENTPAAEAPPVEEPPVVEPPVEPPFSRSGN